MRNPNEHLSITQIEEQGHKVIKENANRSQIVTLKENTLTVWVVNEIGRFIPIASYTTDV